MKLGVGEKQASIEAAKFLIGKKSANVTRLLEELMLDATARMSSRIAATYALGFLGATRSIRPLGIILNDESLPTRFRGHAAEALGNLGQIGAVAALETCLSKSSKSPALKRWCSYALHELRGARFKTGARDRHPAARRRKISRQ
jgi:HEAT repeat protein